MRILITSALPYANGPLHFGHIAGAYLPGDCYARFQRLRGHDVLYICGSDEHGVAITLSAETAGRTPKEHVDLFHGVIKNFFDQLGFSFDHYSRTTAPLHAEVTQEFFKDLLANGYIEAKITDQLYSERDHRFLADRYVVGTCPKCGFCQARGDECPKCGASYEATDLINPRSKVSGAPLVLKATKHWFLRFDLFKDKLTEWISKKHWKPNVLNFAKKYIEDLKPRAITRDSDWGIPVPLEEAKGKVFYVWFDAPIGYISATKEWAEKIGAPNKWKEYWCEPATKLVQFIGKDNIPFHAVFFPAMIMGQNQPYKLVDELPANEFYNLEGRQFSKSDGWYIDLERFFQKFTPDQIRYVIAANAPESHDAEFTWRDFQTRCNSELLGKFGNLANRVLTFAQTHTAGKVPDVDLDLDLRDKMKIIVQEITLAYEQFHLRKAASLVMELAQLGNVYFDAQKPWVLAKDPSKHAHMQTVIATCLECIKLLALTASPIIPDATQKLWNLLGYSDKLSSQNWQQVINERIPGGQMLPKPQILFQRVEDEMIAEESEKLKALANSCQADKQNMVEFDDVKKLEMRVGKIEAIERVPKSKKLLKFTIDLAGQKRTIVSGIGEKIQDLSIWIGKNVILIVNLKPATIMGVESQGFMLTTDDPNGPTPLFTDAAPGSLIS